MSWTRLLKSQQSGTKWYAGLSLCSAKLSCISAGRTRTSPLCMLQRQEHQRLTDERSAQQPVSKQQSSDQLSRHAAGPGAWLCCYTAADSLTCAQAVAQAQQQHQELYTENKKLNRRQQGLHDEVSRTTHQKPARWPSIMCCSWSHITDSLNACGMHVPCLWIMSCSCTGGSSQGGEPQA